MHDSVPVKRELVPGCTPAGMASKPQDLTLARTSMGLSSDEDELDCRDDPGASPRSAGGAARLGGLWRRLRRRAESTRRPDLSSETGEQGKSSMSVGSIAGSKHPLSTPNP